MNQAVDRAPNRVVLGMLVGLCLAVVAAVIALTYSGPGVQARGSAASTAKPQAAFEPRKRFDMGGFLSVEEHLPRWSPDASLQEIKTVWERAGYKNIAEIDEALKNPAVAGLDRVILLTSKAIFYQYEGEPQRTYDVLAETRTLVADDPVASRDSLYTLIYFQGVSAFRRGETENCIMCRGESSCILPISPAAVTPIRVVPGWRSATSRNTSTNFPMTSGFAGS